MPSSRPLISVPTTLPRCSGAASVAANGTSTCATTENRPVIAVPPSSQVSDGAQALITRPPADSRLITTIRRRRSNRSPSGTSRISPAA
ncbi:hypothetical protein G6F31_021378 [Rhizopus arrhizus]|nr:hypothetical protein G6F31_021378 [Rhizopus arrhizus]